jgi:hypothetical protein
MILHCFRVEGLQALFAVLCAACPEHLQPATISNLITF